MGMGVGIGLGSGGGGGGLTLSASTVAAGATGVVAELKAQLLGTVSYSALTGTTSGVTVASNGNVSLASGLAAGATVTLHARGESTAGKAFEDTFTITAVALPSALGPTTASFQTSASAGTTISSFTGLGSGETMVSVAPNDGRVAIAGSGTSMVVGLTASSAGTANYTFTTSAGRTVTVAVTASAAGVATPLAMPKLKGSYGQVIDNVADAYHITVGDSTSMGKGAGGGAGTQGARSLSTTTKTAERLLALGYKVSCDAFMGHSGCDTIAEYNAYFTTGGSLTGSVAFSASWTISALGCLGGSLFQGAGSGQTCDFTPKLASNVVDIYFANTALGTYTVKCDGIQVGTYSSNNDQSVGVQTFAAPSTTAAAHVWTVTTSAAAGVNHYLLGMVARDTATKRLIFLNAGVRGITLPPWVSTTSAWAPLSMINQIRPASVDLSLGINDINRTYDPANPVTSIDTTSASTSWPGNLATIVNAVSVYGDIMMRTPNRINPNNDAGSPWNMSNIDAAMATAAGATRSVVDTVSFSGSFNVATYNDDLHPKAPFYAALGLGMANMIDANLAVSSYQPLVLTGSLPQGFVGVPYSYQVQSLYGKGVKTFSATGLPAWASISTSGLVTGTPTAGGFTPGIVVSATDTTTTSGAATLTVKLAIQGAEDLNDTFTDTAGTLLPAHVSDLPGGVTWNAANGTWAIDASGRAYPSALGTNSQAASLSTRVPANANQYAEADITYVTGVNAYGWLGLHMNAAGLTGYVAGHKKSTNTWVLGYTNNGTFTQWATSAAAPTTLGTPDHIRFTVVGNVLTLSINSGAVIPDLTYTDATNRYPAAGSAGLLTSGVISTSTTGLRFDNVKSGSA